MITFTIPSLSCGRCVAAITQAIEAIDPTAELDVELSSRSVRIDSDLPVATFAAALESAGYGPTPAPASTPAPATTGCCSAPADQSTTPRRGGCCCG